MTSGEDGLAIWGWACIGVQSSQGSAESLSSQDLVYSQQDS